MLAPAQVTFLVTADPSQARRRRQALSPLRFEPYEGVALASGGEVIFTTDQHIRDVAAMVGDSVADLVSARTEGQAFSSGCTSLALRRVASVARGRRVGRAVCLPREPGHPPPTTPPMSALPAPNLGSSAVQGTSKGS